MSVEARPRTLKNVVAWLGLVDHGVVHLDGLLHRPWQRVENHVLADVRYRFRCRRARYRYRRSCRRPEWASGELVGWLVGHGRGVDGLKEGWAVVPGALVRLVEHVVAVEGRGGDHGDIVWLETSHLEEAGNFSAGSLVLLFGPVDTGDVHLIDVDDEALDTQHLGQESVLLGLGVDTVVGSAEQNSGVVFAAPVIMFLTKSRWPGASMMVQ